MDQIYPIPGDQSCSDYIDNWVDKTIEKEIQRGKKLQELKQKPSLRKNKYHIVSIGGTNIYCQKQASKRRSQSPTKHTRKARNHSPQGINSPTRKRKSKKDSHPCPMRTAELAVPSKRHCIETWRNNFHILPEIMIDRLKQHVFDMTPIAKIPDAIECFERCKNSKRRKRKMEKTKGKNKTAKTKDKSNRSKFEDDPKLTHSYVSSRMIQERQNFSILFGYKIAKKLFRPAIITLNPELERISNVIDIEIEKLLRNGKKYSCTNYKNKRIEAEVIAKITVWISEILDDTADKIIEDQLLDLDEEMGPVLDFLDELIEKVVDICEPEPVMVEISSSSETYNVESSTEYADDEDGDFKLEPKESLASLDLDIFIKKELDTIIDSFDKDQTDEENVIGQNVEDNETQNEIIEGRNDDIEAKERASIMLIPDSRQEHILKGAENDITDDTNPLEVNEQNEFQDANDNLGVRNESENEESNADQGTKVNETINLESNEVDDNDSNKKVKFSEKGLVKNYNTAENEKDDTHKSDFTNPDTVFAEPNDHLLSDADESWPEHIVSPVVRPSVSVSKSISSLGFVVEAEEKTSIIFFDDLESTYILKRTENDTTDDTKSLEISSVINDTTTNSKTNSNEKINDNVEAMHYKTDKDTSEIAADTYDQTEEVIKEERSMKYGHKDAQKIEEDLAQKVAEGISQRASTDSIFIGDASTEPITFENTLEKITEDDAGQPASQCILEKKTIVLEKEVLDIDEAETSDKTTSTSFSLIQREDKSTSAVSQSLANIAKRLSSKTGKPEFSSLRIKPKVDCKVNKDSAPAWVTQNLGKPSPTKDSDKHIRLWCKDLQTGFENLELWNEWLGNTLSNVEIMQRNKASVVYQSREELIREWIYLKKNVDADVVTWLKHSNSTQEKIKCFRKVYKNFQEPSTKARTCNCNKK